MYSGVPHTCADQRCYLNRTWFVKTEGAPLKRTNLLVGKLPDVLLDVALVQVSGHVHQADFGQPKICQLDVTHGGDQQTVNRNDVKR